MRREAVHRLRDLAQQMQNPGSDAGVFCFRRALVWSAVSTLCDTYRILCFMIRSFADKATERLFGDGECPARWRNMEAVALRKLGMVDAATRLDDLLSPPGGH